MRTLVFGLTLVLFGASPLFGQEARLERQLEVERERVRNLIEMLQSARSLVHGRPDDEIHADHYEQTLFEGAHTKILAAAREVPIDRGELSLDEMKCVDDLRKLTEKGAQPYTNLVDLCFDALKVIQVMAVVNRQHRELQQRTRELVEQLRADMDVRRREYQTEIQELRTRLGKTEDESIEMARNFDLERKRLQDENEALLQEIEKLKDGK